MSATFNETSVDFGDHGEATQRLVQAIASNIQKISQNVTQMSSLVEQIGTLNDTESLREKLLQFESYTNQVAKDANKQLKDLNNYIKASNDKVMKAQKSRLANELIVALNKFQEIQKLSMKKQSESISRTKRSLGIETDQTESVLNTNYVENTVAFENHNIQVDNSVDVSQLKEREKTLKKLEHDISDINGIFKDLAVMVHDQGEVVNSIELNIEDTRTQVQTASQNLGVALENQQKARNKKLIFFSIMAFIMAIIIIIIILSLRPWNS